MCVFPEGEISLYAGDTRNFDHICSWSRTRMGGWAVCPKPDPGHNNHPEQVEEKGLPVRIRSLDEHFPTV
jgi:hypothetical protein